MIFKKRHDQVSRNVSPSSIQSGRYRVDRTESAVQRSSTVPQPKGKWHGTIAHVYDHWPAYLAAFLPLCYLFYGSTAPSFSLGSLLLRLPLVLLGTAILYLMGRALKAQYMPGQYASFRRTGETDSDKSTKFAASSVNTGYGPTSRESSVSSWSISASSANALWTFFGTLAGFAIFSVRTGNGLNEVFAKGWQQQMFDLQSMNGSQPLVFTACYYGIGGVIAARTIAWLIGALRRVTTKASRR